MSSKLRVAGSIPAGRTTEFHIHALIASPLPSFCHSFDSPVGYSRIEFFLLLRDQGIHPSYRKPSTAQEMK